MRTLVIKEHPSGEELDRVTLTDSGDLEYSTGLARDIFDGLARTLEITPAEAFDLRTDWSNGYLVSKLAPVRP